MNYNRISITVSLIFGMLVSMPGRAQQYRNLVFEGAGIRGIAYVGAIKKLEERNIMQNIESVAGTSAGAMAALMISLGYNATEIEAILYDTKLQKFNDGKLFFIGGIARMNKNYGWYNGQAFLSWIEKIITTKTNNANITFEELHARKFKDLYVTGTSLNQQRLIVFSNQTYPHMKVKDAVRISMSIPLYFKAVFIDSAGNVLNMKKATGNFDIMVDGGMTGNFPIFVFDSIDQNHVRKENPYTLGLRIDSQQQIIYDSENKGLAPIPVDNFRNYITSFYNYVLENLNRTSLTENDWARTVSISAANIGPKIKRLSMKEKNILIHNGEEATEKFLQRHRQ